MGLAGAVGAAVVIMGAGVGRGVGGMTARAHQRFTAPAWLLAPRAWALGHLCCGNCLVKW